MSDEEAVGTTTHTNMEEKNNNNPTPNVICETFAYFFFAKKK